MVIINEEIENVLLDIYSIEFARNVNTPNYYALKAQLFALDKRYINRVPGRYPAWKRMGWFEFVYKQHIFGYSWDGDNVVLQDYYSLKGNRNENKFYQYNILESRNLNKVMKNKQIIRLTESDLLIYKRVMKLSEEDWIYDYETFVEFDQQCRLHERQTRANTNVTSRPIIHQSPKLRRVVDGKIEDIPIPFGHKSSTRGDVPAKKNIPHIKRDGKHIGKHDRVIIKKGEIFPT